LDVVVVVGCVRLGTFGVKYFLQSPGG